MLDSAPKGRCDAVGNEARDVGQREQVGEREGRPAPGIGFPSENRQRSNCEDMQTGIELARISDLIAENPDALQSYFQDCHVKREEHLLYLLNTAFFTDGIYLKIPDNLCIIKPIHIINITTGSQQISNFRNIFDIGKNSSVKIIESFVSDKNDFYYVL